MTDITITPSQISGILSEAIKHGISVMFAGEPGIGKTEEVEKTGRETLGAYMDCRLASKEPVDFMGIPKEVNGFTKFITPEFLPNAERDGPTGLFAMDEFGDGPQAVQLATQQLILEHKIGSYVFPEGWHMCAMMNRKEQGGVNRGLSYALQNRFMHVTVCCDVPELLTHFISKGVDPIVTSFLKMHSNLAHKRPEKGTNNWAWPSPRNWERVSMIRQGRPDESIKFQLYASLIGEGAAAEFTAHEQVADQVPDPEKCIKEPTKTMVPEHPSAQYAIAVALSHWMNLENIGNVMKYLARMPSEYAVTSILEARKIKPEIADTEEFGEWATENVDIILG
jgi:hypothetical protein